MRTSKILLAVVYTGFRGSGEESRKKWKVLFFTLEKPKFSGFVKLENFQKMFKNR